ncbi:hypothetical protein MINT15_23970 [Saccharomonospora viridis]|uniref:Uncharacterized protein n=1 Tax=Saccharomonospora viridis TaxID=1852 RepID=A0A837D8C1_9PSEU|nr:hypothetical protein MINT15_23970 [Saccharomonospora viridis]
MAKGCFACPVRSSTRARHPHRAPPVRVFRCISLVVTVFDMGEAVFPGLCRGDAA